MTHTVDERRPERFASIVTRVFPRHEVTIGILVVALLLWKLTQPAARGPIFVLLLLCAMASAAATWSKNSTVTRAATMPASRVPDWIFPSILVAFSLFTLVVPAARALYRVETDYNEGWNAYNAEAAAHHVLLYGTKYDWTTVNYPLGSFYLIGFVSRFGGDPVRIGRLLSLGSLLLSCVFVALIVRRLTGRWGPAVFAGAFCLAVFCLFASYYVGMNDPQMLAHPLFLAGLLLYLGETDSTLAIAAIVVLFVVGGNIKHNPLAAPLAVFFDLCSVSKSKVIRFLLFSAVFLGASIAANMLVGGPFFISKLMTPRTYSLTRAVQMAARFGTLQIPLAIALLWSIWQLGSNKFRVISIYLILSLVLGFAFTTGKGVSVNAYFDIFLAMSIVMGLSLDLAWHTTIPFLRAGSPWRLAPPLLICFCLLFALANAPINVRERLRELPVEQRQFDADVSFIASQPGPAICESILRCFYAGKPFVYDPFNAGSLIKFKKLDSREIDEQIAERKFGAIQIESPVADMDRSDEYFSEDTLDAIGRFYEIGHRDPGSVIYVPRPERAVPKELP